MPDRFLRLSIAAASIFASSATGFGPGALRAQPAAPSMSQVPLGQYPMPQAERPTPLVDPSRKLEILTHGRTDLDAVLPGGDKGNVLEALFKK